MSTRTKSAHGSQASVRQSITLPAELAVEVRKVAKQRHITMSRALVTLAAEGLKAETAARQKLDDAYGRFISESDQKRKDEAGKDLIRSIFGETAIAEDPVR